MSRFWVSYVITVAIVSIVVGCITFTTYNTPKEDEDIKIKYEELLKEANEKHEKYVKEAEEKQKSLEKENKKLEGKLEVLMNDDETDQIVVELEKENAELEKQLEALEADLYSYDMEIGRLNEELHYEMNEKNEVVETYNQFVLQLVDILNMNPDIFEYDPETGLLDPQFAINVIELNERDSREYSEIQMWLYEATGIHEPIEAVQYLIEQVNNLNSEGE